MRVRSFAPVSSLVCALLIGIGCTNAVNDDLVRGPLTEAFDAAAAESEVPADLLLAVGWVETRWQVPESRIVDEEHGRGAAGLMGVVDTTADPRLADAAAALGVDVDVARADPATNVRVAARVLRGLALAASGDGTLPTTLAGWRDAVARYGADDDVEAGDLYADDVFAAIEAGVQGVASTGETLAIAPRATGAGGRSKTQGLGADSAWAMQFLPARVGHFASGRSHAIDRIVIHTTEGSYQGAISWFRSPGNAARTSAHYIIRSSDGEITQMVREQDTAFHAREWNARSIGIEHEAISAQRSWFTDAMYRSSARLVRELCDRYGIPVDREHIVGHVEVPGNNHSDPGRYWDWDRYLALVREAGPPSSTTAPTTDACGDLDYQGTCADATLQWCEQGVVRTVDCGARGRACGWQDDSVGNNCVALPPPPADPCNGETWSGRCDGSTLIWCEAGTVRTADCQTCGWQSADVGNNCL